MSRLSKIPSALIFAAALAMLLFLASDRLRGLLANTSLLALGTIALGMPPGILLGTIVAKVEGVPRRAITALLAAVLFVPLYVQAAAWNAVLGSGGLLPQALAADGGYAHPWLAGWRGAIWVHAMAAIPWAALMTAASLRVVERQLEEESLLDASPLRVLMHVTLRRGASGILAAAVWIAVICATEIAVTDLYQIRTFAEEIYTEASLGALSGNAATVAGSDLAVGVAIIGVLGALALMLIAPWLPKAASLVADASWTWRPGRARVAIQTITWLILAFVLLVPLAGLAWKAGIAVSQHEDGFQRTWSAAKAVSMVAASPWEHRREWGWSLAAGTMAALIVTVLAAALAWSARVRPRLVTPLIAIIVFGLATPAPLWGVWVIAALNHPYDSVFSPLTVLYDRTLLAPVLVQAARALPLVGLWLWSQLASIPTDLLEAARSEGAGPLTQLVRIAIPLRRTGMIAALGIAFVLAISELSATLLVVPPGVTPISVRIFQLLHYGVDDRVAAASLSVFALIGILLLAHRGFRLFRR